MEKPAIKTVTVPHLTLDELVLQGPVSDVDNVDDPSLSTFCPGIFEYCVFCLSTRCEASYVMV